MSSGLGSEAARSSKGEDGSRRGRVVGGGRSSGEVEVVERVVEVAAEVEKAWRSWVSSWSVSLRKRQGDGQEGERSRKNSAKASKSSGEEAVVERKRGRTEEVLLSTLVTGLIEDMKHE